MLILWQDKLSVIDIFCVFIVSRYSWS